MPFVSAATLPSCTARAAIHSTRTVRADVKPDSGSVAKKLRRTAFLALFIYKITTLPDGRTDAISQVPQCLVLVLK